MTESQQTPLHHASCYNHAYIVDLLLYKGADPELKDKEGLTPLDYAVNYPYLEVVEVINEFKDKHPLALKLNRALNDCENGVVSSDTFSDTNLDDVNSFSDGTDFSYTTEIRDLRL
ncbi:ankyrin repeat domain-containing protein [Wolbachia pipientis]|nr:ankyrin repeat domain-containing protein [Wolbachia pipientis]